jgi:hypothetical protein
MANTTSGKILPPACMYMVRTHFDELLVTAQRLGEHAEKYEAGDADLSQGYCLFSRAKSAAIMLVYCASSGFFFFRAAVKML